MQKKIILKQKKIIIINKIFFIYEKEEVPSQLKSREWIFQDTDFSGEKGLKSKILDNQ